MVALNFFTEYVNRIRQGFNGVFFKYSILMSVPSYTIKSLRYPKKLISRSKNQE